MAENQGSIATHVPQSLPSFAQAFSATSLGSISSGNNALPPINTRSSSDDPKRVRRSSSRPSAEEKSTSRSSGRKRTRAEATSAEQDDEHSISDHDPTSQAHVKEEQDHDMLDSTSPSTSRHAEPRAIHDTSGAPAPSSVSPSPLKKRRVTVSGPPQPTALNTDVRSPSDQAASTPISPVVIGFTVQRDNPTAVEQVRSMLTVKQKQKALIEQRRGSVAGVISPGTSSGAPNDDRSNVSGTKSTSSGRARRSPNAGTGTRRQNNAHTTAQNARPPSPSPMIVPSQQPVVPSQGPSLPTQPISFARRRANQLGAMGKRIPADIVISPREDQTPDQRAPSIQSAPPVPHAGQSSFYSGRFAMTLPRLPPVLAGGDPVRRATGGNVPPTPTRLAAMQRNPTGSSLATRPLPAIAGRSPPNASVPISSLHAPQTPSSLHHPGYSGDKSAFLAPFEVFYDALNDSKQLKSWLGEQLQRSNALMQSLTQQQDRLHEVVDSLVEKKVSGMRMEMSGLYRRVDELEDALRLASSNGMGRRQSFEALSSKGKQPVRNGMLAPMAAESYTFPPMDRDRDRLRSESDRRYPSPGWGQDREREHQSSGIDSETGSPAPFDSRRLSLSATRLDPPRMQQSKMNTPPPPFREALPSVPLAGKSMRPAAHRQHSSPRMAARERDAVETPPPASHKEVRLNSVVRPPPDAAATEDQNT